MIKLVNIFFLSIFLMAASSAQDFLRDDNEPQEADNPKKVFEWITTFNEGNNSLEKRNNYLYKLDSSYYYKNGIAINKTDYIYEENRDLFLVFTFNNNTQTFEPESYFVNTFEDNLFVKSTYNLWNGEFYTFDESDPEIIRFYDYNEENLLVEKKSLDKFDIINGGKGNLTIYNYDENNFPSGRSNYYWNYDTNSYVHSTELIFRNNDEGLLKEIVDFKYRPEYGWTIEDSTVFTYNNLNQILIENKHNKGPFRDTFKHQIQKIYEYNIDGSIDKIFEQTAPSNQYPNVWNLNYFHRFNYYAFGSLKSEGLYFVEGPEDTGLDEQEFRLDYEYDGNVKIEDVKMPRNIFLGLLSDYGYYRNHMVLKEWRYEDGNRFEPEFLDYRIQYFYSDISTSTTDNITPDLNINIYPNPSSDFITVDIPDYIEKVTVSITDIHGKKIKTFNYQNGRKIPVSDLDNGVYFYVVKVNDQQYGGKFVVAK